MKGPDMTLENDFNQFWSDFIAEWGSTPGISKDLAALAAITAGSFKTLSGQVDALRRELVSKGIDVLS